jgi:hypothetical protein
MTNEQIGLLALVCFLFIIVIPLTIGIIETAREIKRIRQQEIYNTDNPGGIS